ncbi:peptidase E [Steroidobacter sp.]|uniref:Type 1 glutamine amidotransferase-like domain-containing protein n=1 Tax=Steroidobacter sp. TaxID=1978227 RepID=UPI001A405B65|nr:peptidase E [Steroidobacter sp.]MBL8267986.1 Type 1 glutamine amidotransferase-like domain-containing protein [Steroidobacter sp.]
MAKKFQQIFGVGGCFFTEPWERPLLQQQMLSLAGSDEPKICYIGTAGGDNPADIEQFYRQMTQHRCRLSHLKLFEPHTDRFQEYFLQQDIIYVGGGATRNLMALWRDWGLVDALRTAWEAGVVLAGTSAGSICWFEGCITDSLPERLLPLACTGFLRGSGCTHYDARPDRPQSFQRYLLEGAIPAPGIATENHTALYYRGTELFEVVTAVRGKQAYRLDVVDGAIKQSALPARYLGD